MEIKNNKPAESSEPRRFSAGRAVSKPGANSFAAALKKASDAAPAPKAAAPALPDAPQPLDTAAAPQSQESQTAGKSPAAQSEAPPADSDAAFADHMELVRFRLKTGYYASKAINDALTDKLSGYFDELA
ncbi:MAG: hypothetical protein JF616_04530 [Fibrobacteres bacterium]|jgi:hypothetical protein|nr:hypothetical protein [Fibrobacterota bacterium]